MAKNLILKIAGVIVLGLCAVTVGAIYGEQRRQREEVYNICVERYDLNGDGRIDPNDAIYPFIAIAVTHKRWDHVKVMPLSKSQIHVIMLDTDHIALEMLKDFTNLFEFSGVAISTDGYRHMYRLVPIQVKHVFKPHKLRP